MLNKIILSYIQHFEYGETAQKNFAEAGDNKTLYESAGMTELRQVK